MMNSIAQVRVNAEKRIPGWFTTRWSAELQLGDDDVEGRIVMIWFPLDQAGSSVRHS
jgi:hypothetical protein